MKRHLLAAAAAAITFLATAPTFASSAAPTSEFHGCPSGYTCLWEHANYKGTRVSFPNKCSKELVPVPAHMRDKASSAYMSRLTGGLRVSLTDTLDGTHIRQGITIGAGDKVPFLNVAGKAQMNDSIDVVWFSHGHGLCP
ncbi:hypothetical protein GCM10017557_82900 [Streptomyces aurantiacus]|uniref:Peptidase inhibitor family I36 protein n=1 Tax=Streptomyces aurantiacus TaxID=47760 RepID=A0A7G1PFT9_9ACTN|nr:hypothetical protein GCM10017557_82900 [Streptomyces aurantiacus]